MKKFYKELLRIFLVLTGGALMAVNINTFVHSAELIPGGFSGLALLIQSVCEEYWNFHISFSVLMWTFNIFPIYIGFRYIGKNFTIYSILMIFVSGLLTDLLPAWTLTEDVLLCAVFGGLVNAISVALCLFADSSSGGTDFISIYLSEKTGKSAWNTILVGNIIILTAAGFLISWNSALYSIIFQFVSTQALNMLYKRYSKTTLFIITNKAQKVYETIRENTHHDATLFKGKGCYMGSERDMLYSVVNAGETGSLEKEIRKIDPEAFINVVQSKEIIGKFFKRSVD